MQKRDVGALTGALFVVLVLVAFFAVGGNTPDGDASARKVVSFYSDNDTKEMIAAVVLALSAVPLLYFTAILRDRLRAASAGSQRASRLRPRRRRRGRGRIRHCGHAPLRPRRLRGATSSPPPHRR